MLLDLLSGAFPDGVQLPKNISKTKKANSKLGLSYDIIDVPQWVHIVPEGPNRDPCLNLWHTKVENYLMEHEQWGYKLIRS